jgi:hypothetical protein
MESDALAQGASAALSFPPRGFLLSGFLAGLTETL